MKGRRKAGAGGRKDGRMEGCYMEAKDKGDERRDADNRWREVFGKGKLKIMKLWKMEGKKKEGRQGERLIRKGEKMERTRKSAEKDRCVQCFGQGR